MTKPDNEFLQIQKLFKWCALTKAILRKLIKIFFYKKTVFSFLANFSVVLILSQLAITTNFTMLQELECVVLSEIANFVVYCTY